MNNKGSKHPRCGLMRNLIGWVLVGISVGMFLGVESAGSAPAQVTVSSAAVEEWLQRAVDRLFGEGGMSRRRQEMPRIEPGLPLVDVGRLTLDQAMALFLKQNLDLVMANYGIDAAKGRQITARLFPNPTLGVGALSSLTQGCTAGECGAVIPSISQLFEVAGKRGFRIQAAAQDTSSAEAGFEDAVRQLGFTLKETYFRVQRHRSHLAVDQEVLDNLTKLLPRMVDKSKQFGTESDRVRVGLLVVNAEAEVLQDLQTIEEVSGDLRMLLRLPPDVEFELETKLTYRPVSPSPKELLQYALENRPDIRALRSVRDRRKTQLQLAKVTMYPNVTAQLGYGIQGPRGPDNQQQWALSLSAPLPVFDRNQGGIVEAEVAVRTAEADIEKTMVLIQNEIAVAYRKLLHSQRLVQATNGALERASTLFRYSQEGYAKGEIGILDLENAERAYGDTEESHLDALFSHQQSLLHLERAAGRTILP